MAIMPKVQLSAIIDDGTVPEGTYGLRVDTAEFVDVPKKHDANPYIKVRHRITGPEGEWVGRMVFANYPISGKGLYRLGELLTVTGHPEDFELEHPEQLLGLEFRALLMVEKGMGVYPDKNIIKRHLELL
jgi:hypothetical protein